MSLQVICAECGREAAYYTGNHPFKHEDRNKDLFVVALVEGHMGATWDETVREQGAYICRECLAAKLPTAYGALIQAMASNAAERFVAPPKPALDHGGHPQLVALTIMERFECLDDATEQDQHRVQAAAACGISDDTTVVTEALQLLEGVRMGMPAAQLLDGYAAKWHYRVGEETAALFREPVERTRQTFLRKVKEWLLPPPSGEALYAVHGGGVVEIINSKDLPGLARGRYAMAVVEEDDLSFAVRTGDSCWWFHRGTGRAYSGKAHVAKVVKNGTAPRVAAA